MPNHHPFNWKKLKRKASFKPRARIIRLLGEELISSEIVALSELIKNSHDSDATIVNIDFEDITGKDPTIKITDNGSGMDENTFLSEWLQFGGSWKRDKLFTKKGRPLLGQMGIGRFAADKLACELFLISRSQKNGKELHAYFDWNKFDPHTKMLSELGVRWDTKEPTFYCGKKHGTSLIMKGARIEWTEKHLKDLKTILASMIHPFGPFGQFNIKLNCPEYPSISGKLNGLVFNNAHYTIKAHLEHDGVVSYQIGGEPEHSILWEKNGGRKSGPVTTNIFAWDLEKQKDLREPVSFEMRKLLRHWNGMLIFRDGFRVWPFGKNGDDWMGLDRRRVDNPTVHLGNNQIIGLINISSRHNPNLRDLTNREGMRTTKALVDLKRFITQAILPPLESYRRNIRKQKRFSIIKNELDPKHAEKFKMIKDSKSKIKLELDRIERSLNKKRIDIKLLDIYKKTLEHRFYRLN